MPMRLWVLAVMGLMVCLGVPALILNSAEALGQMPVGKTSPGICARTGGASIVVDVRRYCHLRDGHLIDRGLAFRGRYRPAVMPDPAGAHCKQDGGWIDTVDGPGGQTGYCRLPTGAVVEKGVLSRGR